MATVADEQRPDRRRFWALVVAVVALSVLLVRCNLPGDAIDDGEGIVGTYVVNGTDPNGVEYSGTVTIDRADGDRYTIEWLVTGTIQAGTGELRGTTLEVVWSTTSSGTSAATGTATYELGDDGVLRGTRTIDGVDGTGVEEIFPST